MALITDSLVVSNTVYIAGLTADIQNEVSVSESAGPAVEICVSLSASSFESDVVIQVVTEPGTAVGRSQSC